MGSAPRLLAQLAVQRSDKLHIAAPGYYPQRVAGSGVAFSLLSFVTNLLQLGPVSAPDASRPALPLLQLGLSAGLTAIPQVSGGVPKGYLRVLFFNQDSVLLTQQTVTRQLSQAANSGYEVLQTDTLTVAQNGYVTVYVGNDSPADVYFDDIRITHRPGLQVQETQYEPWGLSLAGLDYQTPGLAGLNRYQVNGMESQPDLGLNLIDFGARLYEAALGRWRTLDPLADKMRRYSPYTYCFDNPLRFLDPDGMGPEDVIPLGKNAAAAYNTYRKNAQTAANSNDLAQQAAGQRALNTLTALEQSSVNYYINANEETKGKGATATGTNAQIIEAAPITSVPSGGSTDFNWDSEHPGVIITISPEGAMSQAFLGDELATAKQFEDGQFGFSVQGPDGDNTNPQKTYGYTLDMEVKTKEAAVDALRMAGSLNNGTSPGQVAGGDSKYDSVPIMNSIAKDGHASPAQVNELGTTKAYRGLSRTPTGPTPGYRTAHMQGKSLVVTP